MMKKVLCFRYANHAIMKNKLFGTCAQVCQCLPGVRTQECSLW